MPTATCVIHEVGHATIAHRQGGHGSIVFFWAERPHWAAFATNSKLGAPPLALIIRSLAGITVQAHLHPDSVSDWLGPRLREGGLFGSGYCLRKGSRAEREMAANQAGDDWQDIKTSAQKFSRSVPARLHELRAAEAELAAIWASPWFPAVVQAMSADIAAWLDQDGDYLPGYVSYPPNRIAGVFAQVPGALPA